MDAHVVEFFRRRAAHAMVFDPAIGVPLNTGDDVNTRRRPRACAVP
jgi:hypothetical protein